MKLHIGPFLALVFAGAAACSDGAPLPGASDSGAAPGGDLAVATATDGSVLPQPDMTDDHTTKMSISIGPIPLAAGQETTVCSTFRLDNAAPIDVVRISAKLAPGSHHLIFYKSAATTEKKALYKCAPLDVFGTKDVPLYIAETIDDNTLPLPTGVAYHLEAGQMVKLEAHYLNASPKPVNGAGTVELAVGTLSSYQKADIMFCGSVLPLYKGQGQGVPPGDSSLPPAFYHPPAGTKMFGLTTHQHMRGSLMEVAYSKSLADPGTNLVMGKPYDNPPFPVWDDAHLISFDGSNGLRWQCHYHNPDPVTYYFGESAESNEMCFLWAYYFPSADRFIAQECVR